jgi:hypothetical protein
MEGRSNLGILTALKLAYKGNFVTGGVPAPPVFHNMLRLSR